ncbi:hypothetical protein DKU75_07980 [Salmonella enterica subsp. enterica serovar Oranienburg]|nr:hypothetical protein [Salmonella enterica subsp. enterica serovar Oranienburg]EBQ9820442.1 hypothetical protein [Salmonella enterica subsp. enterica serovar Oranienburg]EBU7106096.1 hypothetical protein [Salmonella enterica subsp. enterica serovar Oranienburg]EBW2817460.1 hypothetical protein [Salmonella enterica subsp. enterica serovar Oranienburg]ECF2471446.1 hypothetical protein [Salmonella enterica subsp. enterica serovar Oranienburg]
MFNPLNTEKARAIYPFYDGYNVKPGQAVTVAIESREMEMAILAAFDYGIDALNDDGRHQLDRLLADLKVAITGR